MYLVTTTGMEHHEVHDVYEHQADAEARRDRLNEGYRKDGMTSKWLEFEAAVVPMNIL